MNEHLIGTNISWETVDDLQERSAQDDVSIARAKPMYHGAVCFISDALLRRVSEQLDLKRIHALDLHLSSEEGKIRVIEHLDKCINLRELNLGYNMISRIQGLESLTKLTELNLAENNIHRIEGIEHLQLLEKLNLSGNRITRISKVSLPANRYAMDMTFNCVTHCRPLGSCDASASYDWPEIR